MGFWTLVECGQRCDREPPEGGGGTCSGGCIRWLAVDDPVAHIVASGRTYKSCFASIECSILCLSVRLCLRRIVFRPFERSYFFDF